jgi:hypothetical protein
MAGAQHPLTALRHLRAEQRGMGLSGKMGGRGNSLARHKNEEAHMSFAFCRESERTFHLRHLLAPLLRLVTAKPKRNQIEDAERGRVRSTPADDSTLERTNLFFSMSPMKRLRHFRSGALCERPGLFQITTERSKSDLSNINFSQTSGKFSFANFNLRSCASNFQPPAIRKQR